MIKGSLVVEVGMWIALAQLWRGVGAVDKGIARTRYKRDVPEAGTSLLY